MRSFSRGLRFAPDGGCGGIGERTARGSAGGGGDDDGGTAGSSLLRGGGNRESWAGFLVIRRWRRRPPLEKTRRVSLTDRPTDRGKSRRAGILGYEPGPPLTHLMPTYMIGQKNEIMPSAGMQDFLEQRLSTNSITNLYWSKR